MTRMAMVAVLMVAMLAGLVQNAGAQQPKRGGTLVATTFEPRQSAAIR